VKITIDLNDQVYAGLAEMIQRDEFKQWKADSSGQSVLTGYPSVEVFVAERVIRDGLMMFSGMIPVVATLQQSIADQQANIQALLTPAVAEEAAS
jgi:hypothetical protein